MNILKHYSAILDEMLENHMFWRAYFQAPYCRDFGEYLKDNETIGVFNGATRGAIVDENEDWIVKFDLSDCYDDNCAREVEIYEAAKEAGCADYLCACKFLGIYTKEVYAWDAYDMDCCGSSDSEDWDNFDFESQLGEPKLISISIPLYAYERVDEFYNGNSHPSRERCDYYRHARTPLAERSSEVAAAFEESWGEDAVWKFTDFCNEWNINDLHTGNVGWRGDKFVIMDYVGYHS